MTSTLTLAEGNSLSAASLLSLFKGELDVIRIKDYYPKEQCSAIVDRLFKSEYYGNFENIPVMARVAQSYYEGMKSPEIMQRYWDTALKWMRTLRELCHPNISPIDKLRLEVDEIWPKGAHVGIMDGKKMLAGIVRFHEKTAYSEPHQDNITWHVQEGSSGKQIIGQIGLNLYMRMPKEGGLLELWRLGLGKNDYFSKIKKGSYGIDRDKLPPVDFTLTPEEGELILINTRRLHAVTECQGLRSTWSCFIGFSSEDKPLMLWS